MKLLSTILSVAFSASIFSLSAQSTYTNPIIHADYSDPDICVDGGDYYLTASSFVSIPGLPILHSTDLVNWEIANYAIPQGLQDPFFDGAPKHGKGVWAPSIRKHNDKFYIYWGDPDFGIYAVTASDPLGEWSQPQLVLAGKGFIDPCPLWDEDGKAYLVHAWAGSRSGLNSILTMYELSPDGMSTIGSPVMVFDGNDGVNHTVEGPKLYKRDGYYYIFAPAGGVQQGWQLVLRSQNPFGPYESKIVMSQGDTDINGPHQGGLVETEFGESWFVHFQDRDLYGRILHLNPVEWKDGWPVIGEDKDGDGCGQPVRKCRLPQTKQKDTAKMQASDSFDSSRLGLQWQWPGNYQPQYGFATPYGYFRLYSHIQPAQAVNMWEVPTMLLQKFPSEAFTATAKVKITAKSKDEGWRCGLIVMGLDYGSIAVSKQDGKLVAEQADCYDAEHGGKENLVAEAPLGEGHTYKAGAFPNTECEIYLRVKVDKGGICHFSYSQDGKKFKPLGQPFQAKQGKWIGAKVGVFAVAPQGNDRCWIDIDDFTID